MKDKGFLFIAMASVLFISFTGCSKDSQNKPVGPGKAEQVINIKTAEVASRPVTRSVEAVGTLAPWDEAIVSNETPGTVEKITADLGDRVKSGDTLAVLDQREATLNYDDALAAHQTNLKTLDKERARASDARTTLERYDGLFKDGMVSVSQHDSAKMQYDVAEAQAREAEARVKQSEARLDLAKKRLNDTVIKAPISGEVKKRFVSVGESIKEKTQMFAVVSTGTLKFRGTVAEASVPRLKTGQDVSLSVEAFKDKTFRGKLTRVSPAVDAQTRTLEVEASVPNPGGLLKPGFFAKGLILTNVEKDVPFVPDEAVYTFVGITKVFVIEDGVAKERLINTGIREGGMIEVADKVKPGQTVATTNLSVLFDGAKVKVDGK